MFSKSILFAIAIAVAATATAGSITGKVKCKGARDNSNVVVYVDKIAGKTFPAPGAHAKMDQKDFKFIPHVLPVLAGTTVDFLNSDKVLHNVYSPDACTGKFNLGSWPQGDTKAHTFTKPGCESVLLCNVHPEMEGYVMTVETPYHAVTDKEGNYKIDNVPAGGYTLKVWHEKLKAAPQQVTVGAGSASVSWELAK
jgi:plastocyanin